MLTLIFTIMFRDFLKTIITKNNSCFGELGWWKKCIQFLFCRARGVCSLCSPLQAPPLYSILLYVWTIENIYIELPRELCACTHTGMCVKCAFIQIQRKYNKKSLICMLRNFIATDMSYIFFSVILSNHNFCYKLE